jgi:hypothetical protein
MVHDDSVIFQFYNTVTAFSSYVAISHVLKNFTVNVSYKIRGQSHQLAKTWEANYNVQLKSGVVSQNHMYSITCAGG